MIICGDEFMAKQYIPKGGNMIDVGSCYGMWVEFMLEKADVVYAFEPDMRLFPDLINKYSSNPKVKLHNIAISEACGVCKLQINPEGNSRIGAIGEETIMMNIDTIFENIPISCIKIDIEGFEMSALNGGLKTILKYLPVLIIEAHDNRNLIKSFFETYHYKIVFSHGRSRFPQTDNGIMVAIHESKMKDNIVEVDIKNTFRRFCGKVALSMLESEINESGTG